MTSLDGLLQAIVSNPQAEDRWLILADFLEEHDDPRRAELLRLHRRLLATCCEPERYRERACWHSRVVELLVQGVRPCVPRKTVALGPGVEMAFRFIPPGSFLMGSPESEEGRKENETLRRVTLTQGFWLGSYLVTQVQWQVLMGSNPSHFKGDNHPVEQVLWDDAQTFCHRLGNLAGVAGSLPTEAAWEYACRAGSTTAHFTGEGEMAVKQAGWCNFDGSWGTGKQFPPGTLEWSSLGETRPVGQFAPNAWGLYDMHGNVWEWCQDWYEWHREGGDRIDPEGPENGTERVLRGGCWWNNAPACRSASRTGCEPDFLPASTIGCRVCLCLE